MKQKNKHELEPYLEGRKLGSSSFFCLSNFPIGNKVEIYDSIFDTDTPDIWIPLGNFKATEAEGVGCLTLDFDPCDFTLNRKGYLKMFLYPDKSLLGKAHYDKGSKLTEEHLKGHWFLHDGYIYLEVIWTDLKGLTFNLWGWADIQGGEKVFKTKRNITTSQINYLFDWLWPMMPFAIENKQHCLRQIKQIQAYFEKSGDDHDALLSYLITLPNIGITTGTGLIWAVYPENRVPFDKYTLGFALREGILQSQKITGNYVKASEKILKHCEKKFESPSDDYIVDFVRKAKSNIQQTPELAIEPK
jgi:hypothetical protein